MTRIDSISIPIALLVLAWRVRSPPLLLIPPLCLAVGMLFSFALLDAVSLAIRWGGVHRGVV
jgi:hypothetical protein